MEVLGLVRIVNEQGVAAAVHGGAEGPEAWLRPATAPAQLRSGVRRQGVRDFRHARRSAATRWWALAGVRLSLRQVCFKESFKRKRLIGGHGT
jgi:hypothetical protein